MAILKELCRYLLGDLNCVSTVNKDRRFVFRDDSRTSRTSKPLANEDVHCVPERIHLGIHLRVEQVEHQYYVELAIL